MGQKGYYKLDNLILEFKPEDVEVKFNHYIMKKENYQRIKGNLEKGCFYLTVRNTSKDLNISISKAQRLIKKFIELEIISCSYKSSNCSKPSIYKYNSVSEEAKTIKKDKIKNVKKFSGNELLKQEDEVFKYVNNKYDDSKLRDALIGFCNMRIQIQKPLTLQGIEMLIKKLDELESDYDRKVKILEHSILNSYSDIYPLKKIHKNINNKINNNDYIC